MTTPYDSLQFTAPAELRTYPEQIEDAALEHFRLGAELDDIRFDLGQITDPITADVASDNAYKNDTARRAEVKLRLADSVDYTRLDKLLRETERYRVEVAARLERLRGEFSLYKLAWRERIARLESTND